MKLQPHWKIQPNTAYPVYRFERGAVRCAIGEYSPAGRAWCHLNDGTVPDCCDLLTMAFQADCAIRELLPDHPVGAAPSYQALLDSMPENEREQFKADHEAHEWSRELGGN